MAEKHKKSKVCSAVGRIRCHVRPRTLFYFLMPLICFYCLEFYTHDPWLMAFIPQLINYLLFLAAGLFLYELTGRIWCSAVFLSLYSLTVGIVNYFVMSFRNNPLLPWDLKSAKTALSVSSSYNYDIDYRFVVSTSVLILMMICGCVLSRKNSRPLRDRIRLGTCAGSLIFLFVTSLGMMNSTVTGYLLTPTNLFTQWASYRDNGFTVTFLQNLQYLHIKKPAGYNAETLDKELQEFLASHDNDAENASDSSGQNHPTDAQTPHIIAIMNESFSDLSVLHDFETNEDYMPYVHSLQKQNLPNLITGHLFVSVCGGNTANTEFEFLTGNTMAFLPSGSIPYQQYISGELSSLASQYDSEGYTTTGLHPYNASGWNRNLVYPWLGFENTCFRSDFYPVRIIRKYVSDESAYSKLSSLYEKRAPGEKLFLFEVTMQNHGGYSEIYDNFPIQIKLKDIHTTSSTATENYLTLIQESDRTFQELISTFESADEPVIIIMFGDHQPNDYVSENIASLTGTAKEDRSLEESQNRYIVPYVIWANFNLNKESAGLSDAEYELLNSNTLSSNYLGACLTRLAGLETTDYQDFLLILKETLPVITANVAIDKDGNYMTIEEAKKAYPELMSLYEKLQYRALFDQN
ncbi:MAG: LTA synthase family protein [Lachnospiraceae bacterium]